MRRLLVVNLVLLSFLSSTARAACPFVTENPQINNISNRLGNLLQSIDENNRSCRAAIQSAIDSIRTDQSIAESAFARQTENYYSLQDINRRLLVASETDVADLIDQRASLEREIQNTRERNQEDAIRQAQGEAYQALLNLTSLSSQQACAQSANSAPGIMDAGLGLLTLASPALAAGDLAVRAGARLFQGVFRMLEGMSTTASERHVNRVQMDTYLCLYHEMLTLQCRFENQRNANQDQVVDRLVQIGRAGIPSESDRAIFSSLANAKAFMPNVSTSLSELALGRMQAGSNTVEGAIEEITGGGGTSNTEQQVQIQLNDRILSIQRLYEIVESKTGPERSAQVRAFNNFLYTQIRNLVGYEPALGGRLGITSESGGLRQDVDYFALWSDPVKRQLILDASRTLAEAAQVSAPVSVANISIESIARRIRQDQARGERLQQLEQALERLTQDPPSGTSQQVIDALTRHREALDRAKGLIRAANQCVANPNDNQSQCASLRTSLGLNSQSTAQMAREAVEREVTYHLSALERGLSAQNQRPRSEFETLAPARSDTGMPVNGFEKYMAVYRSIEEIRASRNPDPADLEDIRILRRQFEDSRSVLNLIGRGLDVVRSEPERLKQICAMMRFSLRASAAGADLVQGCRGVPLPSRFGNRTGACAYNDYMVEESARDRVCTGQSTRFPLEPAPTQCRDTSARPSSTVDPQLRDRDGVR